VHALGKGLVVYEIQQASDTTYRLYDYGRDRKIDVQESLANITVPFKPIKLSSRSGELLSTPYFVLDKIMNVKKTKYEYYQCQ
jgi:mannose-6-phosphate isomerase